MRRFRPLAMLLAWALVVACGVSLPGAQRQLVVALQGASYRTLALVDPYGASDVKRLELTIARLDGTAETPVADPVVLTSAPLAQRVTFGNLGAGELYRVRAAAYDAASGGTRISRDDAFADVRVPYDEAPSVLNLTVGLRDRPFEAAGAFGGVAIEAGGLAPDAAGLAPALARWRLQAAGRTVQPDARPARPNLWYPADPARGERLALRRDAGTLHCQRQRADGTPLEAERVLGSGATQGPWGVFDPGQGAYVVLWSEGPTVRGRRVGRDGQPLGAAATLATAFPATAYTGLALNDGDRELALMTVVPPGGGPVVHAVRFRADLSETVAQGSAPALGGGRINCELQCAGQEYDVALSGLGFGGVTFEPAHRRYSIYYNAPGRYYCHCMVTEADYSTPLGFEAVDLVP